MGSYKIGVTLCAVCILISIFVLIISSGILYGVTEATKKLGLGIYLMIALVGLFGVLSIKNQIDK